MNTVFHRTVAPVPSSSAVPGEVHCFQRRKKNRPSWTPHGVDLLSVQTSNRWKVLLRQKTYGERQMDVDTQYTSKPGYITSKC